MKILQIWMYGAPTAAENGLDDTIATAKQFGFDAIAQKALDGLTWMGAIDHHPDAIGSVDQVAQLTARAHAAGLQFYCWTNPRHDVDVDVEATLTGQLANACDGVFLDTEPYAQFWNNDAPIGQAAHFMAVLRQTAPLAFIALQPDPRPQALAGIKVDEWAPRCNAIAGQHYWTDFSSDPRAELANAAALGQRFGLPVFPTLPGNADPASVPTDLVAAFPGFVVWRLGSTGPAMLQVLGAIAPSAPASAPAPDPSQAATPAAPDATVPRETPDDWPAQWPTWREAAINYKGIADAVGKELADQNAAVARAAVELAAALSHLHDLEPGQKAA